jgi:hypothetical protein
MSNLQLLLTLTNCNEDCKDEVACLIASFDRIALDEKHFSTTFGCTKKYKKYN